MEKNMEQNVKEYLETKPRLKQMIAELPKYIKEVFGKERAFFVSFYAHEATLLFVELEQSYDENYEGVWENADKLVDALCEAGYKQELMDVCISTFEEI